MSQDNTITPSRQYTQLSKDDRIKIEAGLKHADTHYKIARDHGRSQSTIDREVKKGTVPQQRNGSIAFVYFADVGQSRHEEARLGSRRPLKIAQCRAFMAEVDSKIAGHNKKCGPDGFVGALREFGGYSAENSVCTKTLHKYISESLMETKTTDLPSKLKRLSLALHCRFFSQYQPPS
ncbi:MAG: helix-turn-helix domain-containing protein [Eubacteriaceae bacterium]|nr:helix-turn-helix domain-containing protein [Eubacteriaceae bacterium]